MAKRNRTPAQVCDFVGSATAEWEAVFDALVACFTAYTHLRRLLIVRHLGQNASVSIDALCSTLGMSEDACRRHLAKLHKRGLVSCAGRGGSWQLATPSKTTCSGALLAIVRRALDAS